MHDPENVILPNTLMQIGCQGTNDDSKQLMYVLIVFQGR